MKKKILGITAAALFAVTFTACANTSGGTADTGKETVAGTADSIDGSEAALHGPVLNLPDISSELKASGTKADISEIVNKYKPMVTLADYKSVKVTKGDAYEMTEQEVQDELEMLKENLKGYDDVTEGGVTQDGDSITMTSEATLDGQPYEEYSFQDQFYEIGSGYITEDFDKQLIGKKANEDFEMDIKFPDDYMEEEYLKDGETSLNGKTLHFKAKISSIERAKEEALNDEWVKAHAEDLTYYGYDSVNTVDELKAKIKSINDESRAKNLLEGRGIEALSYVISKSTFSSYPEDELSTLKEQTKSNIQQEYEAYKDMSGVNSIEEYLEQAYEIKGESALDDYATEQAQQYLKNKMAVTLIADDAGIEVGEEDITKLGNEMALYYGFDSYDAMLEQYGDEIKENTLFETLYKKVVMFLGSQADPTLESEATDDLTLDEPDSEEIESENEAAD